MGLKRWRRSRRGRLLADRFNLGRARTLDELAELVAAETGRQIVFDITDELDAQGPSGRLDRYGSRDPEHRDLDVIRLPADVDDVQREHIALHELGHILAGDALDPADGVDLGPLPLMASIYGTEALNEAYEMTGSAFRSCHDGDPEQEEVVESFAFRMRWRLRRAKIPHARDGVDCEKARLAERADRTFGAE